ncbi:hypothetical protein Phum_PHUM309400 [Pediculus humanus corporis]|uniref:Uncharacterized protein n=1 Tax=Pediculus humanus subsp. corporis TaxID=121224 RepID=E0VMH6_PEDHC|nr:uncharacterized protein Phum_PHUM309400 [Pediculus humanus corporis]EEB14582.1 hypothetical protein Phum_PHUM309400 [Pediculus humanus corporis]
MKCVSDGGYLEEFVNMLCPLPFEDSGKEYCCKTSSGKPYCCTIFEYYLMYIILGVLGAISLLAVIIIIFCFFVPGCFIYRKRH